MNKYITALLVVLAATGVEAQTYQSALKAALGNCSIEEICHQVELRGVETDILSVIEAYKNISKEEKKEPSGKNALALSDRNEAKRIEEGVFTRYKKELSLYLPNPSVNSGIIIRAPSAA
ncbi:hypothetical protein [Prevotella sp. HUN102]|uniref:hypothetical protein n=1 Tax=Prevotella sp. HUN102 TaxID=1392486 RepID=UPI00048ADC04|nr:hypothetical protein [Prevotella sp. HUN102]